MILPHGWFSVSASGYGRDYLEHECGWRSTSSYHSTLDKSLIRKTIQNHTCNEQTDVVEVVEVVDYSSSYGRYDVVETVIEEVVEYVVEETTYDTGGYDSYDSGYTTDW